MPKRMTGHACVAEEEPFAFDGKYNQLRHVNLWPKPIQKPHPPIYIPGGGSIETWDFCLDHDYNYSYLSFTGICAVRNYWMAIGIKLPNAARMNLHTVAHLPKLFV